MEASPEELAQRARMIVRQRLESLERAGVEQLPKPRLDAPPLFTVTARAAETIATPTAAAAPAVRAPAVETKPTPPNEPAIARPAPSRDVSTPRAAPPASDRVGALELLRCEVADCTKCAVLAEQRKQTVFGVGNPNARLCFFGEAPGADEDAVGEPFVGKAGQLLNKIIEACTFRREDVYILNVLKCRPPNNRPPEEQEVANCRSFFERQLAIIHPEYIVCLGASAAKALLQTPASIGKLRGSFHKYGNAKVLATYHPAYLLRNPAAKADVWEDMKLLLKEMGIELPRKGS